MIPGRQAGPAACTGPDCLSPSAAETAEGRRRYAASSSWWLLLTRGISATAAAVLTGTLLTGTAACTAPVACAGPCTGPPYGLQVTFRPGTTTQAAIAALRKCATGPVVERVGRLITVQASPSTKPYLITTIYTRAAAVSQTGALLTCLDHAPTVQGAAFPG